ncbi:uncharacterized protein LOC107484659 [Arachis duranensis]|uniref:Uncharacterized protein LOC107484659 n=1 Tax=Arachis duranensis TaxID=130453 RepID=A0A6P4D3B2_ARADU|nr:uncharacterized protein LOC107484659 [Arachis duranensis]
MPQATNGGNSRIGTTNPLDELPDPRGPNQGRRKYFECANHEPRASRLTRWGTVPPHPTNDLGSVMSHRLDGSTDPNQEVTRASPHIPQETWTASGSFQAGEPDHKGPTRAWSINGRELHLPKGQGNWSDAQQLFQRDAQTITPEALESVKAAIASSDVDHKTDAKRKAVPRRAAGQTWEDPSLAEWPENDHRLFCGDLGNEVNDDVLSKTFTRFPSFNMARVVRDKRSGKTKGYGFVSFADPSDLAVALKEMNGKYVGNRPIKLCKSKWKERTDYDAVDKQKKHSKKKLKSSSKVGVLHY